MVIVSRQLVVRDSVNYVGWIESTGTQYVDLELSMPKGFHVVCDIEFTSLSGFNAVIGAHDQSSPYNRNYLATNGTGWEFGFLGLGSFGSVTTNTRYEIDACNISGSIFCKINGVSQSFDTSGATGSARSELSLYALAMNYSVNLCCARAKLRGLKVYADAGYTNLLRDLRPCFDPEGVACFYDKTEKKYRYNQGSGEFIAGGSDDSGGDVTKTISFTVKSSSYTADEGMTWAQWMASGYNGANRFYASGQYVEHDTNGTVYYNGTRVKTTDTIIADGVYTAG